MNTSDNHDFTLRHHLSTDELVSGVLAGDRTILARAISLIESSRPDHQKQAEEVLARLLPAAGNSIRIGITGVPGVGKSTFINTFGMMLANLGRKVAVLAIDPTSKATHGSILGDKTRMQELASSESAFIRPSPTGDNLGGVARKTRESIFLCEAAGYNTVVVETVGVGQSETEVANMVDFFLLLMVAGTGDELQGIKRGILELADLVAINKADTENPAIHLAQAHITSAFHYLRPKEQDWTTKVFPCSGYSGVGLPEIWQEIENFWRLMQSDQRFAEKRRQQLTAWMWSLADQIISDSFHQDPKVIARAAQLESEVSEGKIGAAQAAQMLVGLHTTK
jgi:LAO/AO transport system kinase